MNQRIFIFIFSLFVFAACRNSTTSVIRANDYEKYMHIPVADSMPSLQRIRVDVDFWSQRLKKNPEDAVAKAFLAGLNGARFKVTGDINDIHASDSLYLVASSLFKTNSSSSSCS